MMFSNADELFSVKYQTTKAAQKKSGTLNKVPL
jgi:hypothetical protein